IIVNYHSKGEDKNTGARLIEVYAYGLTKAGNPCIRCFQPHGDTTTRVPNWKFMRLDRITTWKPTGQHFERSADFYYKNIGDFNPDGDETMSVVYKIAKFGNDEEQSTDGPIVNKQEPEVYKTETEKRMERLKQQLDNPINVSDLIGKNGFKKAKDYKDTTKGLTTKDNVVSKQQEPELYKTDTEKGLERLKQQMPNPKFIKDLNPKKSNEISKLRDKLGDTSEPIPYKDLVSRLSNKNDDESSINGPKIKQDKQEPEVYKTDTEKRMDRLRQQLNNPQKIDLTKIPKR
ncbi:MAG: hypothetical protein K2H20_01360, partial [Bacilli bacterium]|nr:hypothetical protein [Bacilli bacterium]